MNGDKNCIGSKIKNGIMKDRTNHLHHNFQTTSVSDLKNDKLQIIFLVDSAVFSTCCFAIYFLFSQFLAFYTYVYTHTHTHTYLKYLLTIFVSVWSKRFSDKKLPLRGKLSFSAYSELLDMDFKISWSGCPKFPTHWEVRSSRPKYVTLFQENNPYHHCNLKCLFFRKCTCFEMSLFPKSELIIQTSTLSTKLKFWLKDINMILKTFSFDKPRFLILTIRFNSNDRKLHRNCLNQVFGENSSGTTVSFGKSTFLTENYSIIKSTLCFNVITLRSWFLLNKMGLIIWITSRYINQIF